MKIQGIDHVVLTVSDLAAAMRFYHDVFGFPILDGQLTNGVVTLRCGQQLVRLQKADRPTTLKAVKPTVGAADMCFDVADTLDELINHFRRHHVKVIAGPVEKRGAQGPMTSLYIRDLDGNLIEVAVAHHN